MGYYTKGFWIGFQYNSTLIFHFKNAANYKLMKSVYESKLKNCSAKASHEYTGYLNFDAVRLND